MTLLVFRQKQYRAKCNYFPGASVGSGSAWPRDAGCDSKKEVEEVPNVWILCQTNHPNAGFLWSGQGVKTRDRGTKKTGLCQLRKAESGKL